MRRAFSAALVALAGLVLLTAPASAQLEDHRAALVLFVRGASMPDLLAISSLRSLATRGGVALMNGRSSARNEIEHVTDAVPERAHEVETANLGGIGDLRAYLHEVQLVIGGSEYLVMVIATSPSAASGAGGDELGTVIAAWGDPDELLDATGEPRALTSDSTRRVGVVADVDPAATVAAWLDLPSEAGAPIQRTDEPAPLELYERYLQQRRLAVPTAVVSWVSIGVAGAIAVLALAFRRRLSPRALTVAAALAAALPWLAIALLLVGHLPSLTVATVAATVTGIVIAGVAFTRWIAARHGIFVALAAGGAVILAILAVEAALGWPAAVTPLAGGGQLDGGRFFGMPNVEIGIVLGAAMFVAHRVAVRTGVLLLVVCALVTASPWTGANFGAGIALFAAAGLWWGIRRRRPWWIVGSLTAVVTAVGMLAVVLMHRYLVDRPTHVTSFLDDDPSVGGVVERVLDRLSIGAELLADSPAALIPVVGTLVLLLLVLRPPASLARSFEGHDAWRDAVFVLLLACVVAYVSEDTGAAAIGFGFGFALSGLLDVSLTVAREKMDR